MKESHRALIEEVCQRMEFSLFYYDLDELKKHITKLTSLKGPGIKLWYATKANPLSAIIKCFHGQGWGMDVASEGELLQALKSGVTPEKIIATGPAKPRDYLEILLERGVRTIVVESINQAYWLEELAEQYSLNPNILLRLQLPWQHGESVLGGDQITPFGLAPEDWHQFDISRHPHLNIIGVHVFQWSNILELDRLEHIWRSTAKAAKELSHKMKIPLPIIDIGGGLGIPYADGEGRVDFQKANSILENIRKEYNLTEIWMELGRYAIGEYGHYCTQVLDRKTVRHHEMLVLDGGINHISRAALTKQHFPCELLRASTAPHKKFHVHGPLCTALDKLGAFELPADIHPGDWLVFNQVGAYGFTESMPYFLCHYLPGEVVIENNRLSIIRDIKDSSSWLV
ncbi:MAG: PLP-dependent decarboxylase [Pseudomonadota bacterium]